MTILQNHSIQKEPELRNFITVHMQQYPFIFSDERKYRIRRHLYFWLFWWGFFSLLYAYTAGMNLLPDHRRIPVSAVNSIFFMIPHMFLSYSLMYFVIPAFILKGKYKSGAAIVLLLFFMTACLSAFVGMSVLPAIRKFLFSYYTLHPDNLSFFLSLLGGLRGAITIGGLAAAIKLMKYWYIKEQRNLQLQKENAESQLQLLKAQVHPHFLFNTLNNIYSYTQNTAPVAAKMVTGLSDLLRFMLYECNQPLVPLSKEVKMLQDYIDLEKIRYGNKLELHLDLPEDTKDIHIAPLLLLPLVENCFKHGTSTMLEQPWVNLQISLQGTQMQMKLMNGKTNQVSKETTGTGIGIKNVEKRLALLYPGKHELNILNEEDVFIINLKVELEYQKTISSVNTKKQEVAHA
jgi:sensor histidine kinase YesM